MHSTVFVFFPKSPSKKPSKNQNRGSPTTNRASLPPLSLPPTTTSNYRFSSFSSAVNFSVFLGGETGVGVNLTGDLREGKGREGGPTDWPPMDASNNTDWQRALNLLLERGKEGKESQTEFGVRSSTKFCWEKRIFCLKNIFLFQFFDSPKVTKSLKIKCWWISLRK